MGHTELIGLIEWDFVSTLRLLLLFSTLTLGECSLFGILSFLLKFLLNHDACSLHR